MALKGKLQFSGRTDTGQVRSHNEDSIFIDADNGLAILADGMGGYKAGEVASAIAVNTIRDFIVDRLKETDGRAVDESSGYTRASVLLREAIDYANETINATANSQPQCEGMGTTVVVLLFYDGWVSIAHVGDSRAYRLRDSRLEQLTMDHSLLQELVARGLYTQEEADRSLNRNIVTRALGIEPAVEVDVVEETALPGDTFLLCSDGLNDMVEDDEIRLTLDNIDASLDNITERLVETANEHGGRDNISVIAIHVVEPFQGQRKWLNRIKDLLS